MPLRTHNQGKHTYSPLSGDSTAFINQYQTLPENNVVFINNGKVLEINFTKDIVNDFNFDGQDDENDRLYIEQIYFDEEINSYYVKCYFSSGTKPKNKNLIENSYLVIELDSSYNVKNTVVFEGDRENEGYGIGVYIGDGQILLPLFSSEGNRSNFIEYRIWDVKTGQNISTGLTEDNIFGNYLENPVIRQNTIMMSIDAGYSFTTIVDNEIFEQTVIKNHDKGFENIDLL